MTDGTLKPVYGPTMAEMLGMDKIPDIENQKKKFFDKVIPLGNLVQRVSFKILREKGVNTKHGIFTSLICAQCALESGYGKHHIGNAQNYFGIKANRSWNGSKVTMKTIEVDKLKNEYESFEQFRAYSSIEESFLDYMNFLIRNKRYSKCFLTDTPEDFATELEKAHYAGNATYYDNRIIGIIQNNDLKQYDISSDSLAILTLSEQEHKILTKFI